LTPQTRQKTSIAAISSELSRPVIKLVKPVDIPIIVPGADKSPEG
jgi:hypothetical protein